MFTLQALKDEIVIDPNTIGYKVGITWKADQIIADLINDVANGATIFRTNIPMSDILAEIDWVDDWTALTGSAAVVAAKQQAFSIITSTAVLDADSQRIRDAMQGVFAGTTGGTLARLQALVQKAGTRAEELFGDGAVVVLDQIGAASNLV